MMIFLPVVIDSLLWINGSTFTQSGYIHSGANGLPRPTSFVLCSHSFEKGEFMTIALQLYTVRDELKRDFEGTIRKVAAMGYQAVETAKDYGGSPENAAKLFSDLGLTVTSAHIDLPVGDKRNEVIETLEMLGTKTAVCPWRPPDKFESLDGIKSVCDELNEAVASAPSLRIGYHNHHFECLKLKDGSLPLLKMLDYLDPSVVFEVDTYWVQTGGANVVDVMNALGKRAALLHMKDGSTKREDAMTALGEGVMDIKAILDASQTDLYVVELDRCATDMMEAVEKSAHYLKGLVNA
jgi:sugar phosphate isomerase/epimerase